MLQLSNWCRLFPQTLSKNKKLRGSRKRRQLLIKKPKSKLKHSKKLRRRQKLYKKPRRKQRPKELLMSKQKLRLKKLKSKKR